MSVFDVTQLWLYFSSVEVYGSLCGVFSFVRLRIHKTNRSLCHNYKKIKINYLRFRSNKLHPIVSLGTLEKHILLQRDKASVISESKSDLFFELIDFEEEEVTKCPL